MRNGSCFILSTFPQLQPAGKPRSFASLALRQRPLYGRKLHHHTGKELDSETGLYYYGARYLDPKTSRWLSGDPAMGEYIPSAPVNEEARKRNGNLPGMGGVFNYVNLHVYHYAGNNPVKLVDPDGEWLIYSVFNFKSGKYDYNMSTPRTSIQIMRTVGSFFPGGAYLPNMQNGLNNLVNRITATNFLIIYDSSSKGFDGVSIAIDILSFSTAGMSSQVYQALNFSNSASGVIGNIKSWIEDSYIQDFLNKATFNMFGGVEDKETAIALGSAFALGAGVYKNKNLENKNISQSEWAMAIKNELLGGNNGLLSNLYHDVMTGKYDD